MTAFYDLSHANSSLELNNRSKGFLTPLINMDVGSDLVSRAKPCHFAIALLWSCHVGFNGHEVPFWGLSFPPWGTIYGCWDVKGWDGPGATFRSMVDFSAQH